MAERRVLVSSLCSLRDTYLVLCAQLANPLEMLFEEELYLEKVIFDGSFMLFQSQSLCAADVRVVILA